MPKGILTIRLVRNLGTLSSGRLKIFPIMKELGTVDIKEVISPTDKS
jgi:hypothetical protein